MNATLAGFLIIAVFIAALWLFFVISRRLAAKGVGWILRWPAAGLVSFFAFFAVAALIGSQISSDEAGAGNPSQPKHATAREVADSHSDGGDEKHLPVPIDEFESRVNDKLEALKVKQIFRLHEVSDGDYGGSANGNAAVILGTTSNNAYVKSVSITFSGKPTKSDNANAKSTAVAVIAVAEPTDIDTARSIYNNLVDGVRNDGHAAGHLHAVYRLNASSPPAVLTITP